MSIETVPENIVSFRNVFKHKRNKHPTKEYVIEITKNMCQLYNPFKSTPGNPVYRELIDGELQSWHFYLFKLVNRRGRIKRILLHHTICQLEQQQIDFIRYFITNQ